MTRACQTRLSPALAAALLCALLGAAGCGPSLPETVPVRGKVTWKGRPLGDGTVVFQPQPGQIAEGLPERPATGYLRPDGTFELTTFRAGDGAVPGVYGVAIHSYLSEPAASEDDEHPSEYVWRIPPRYGDPSQTGLTVEVPAGEEVVEVAFEVKDQ